MIEMKCFKQYLLFAVGIAVTLALVGCGSVTPKDTASHTMLYVTDRVPYTLSDASAIPTSHPSLRQYAPTADHYKSRKRREAWIERKRAERDVFGVSRDLDLNFGTLEVRITGDYIRAATGPHGKTGEAFIPFDTWEKNRFIDSSNRVAAAGPAAIACVTDFIGTLQANLARQDSKAILIFVHGFNNTFAQSVRRGYKLGRGLDLHGTTILYSWPSQGQWYKYLPDSTNVLWSTLHFYRFLGELFREFEGIPIHIVVHSIGSQAVASALWLYSEKENRELPHVKNLIFAAPDIDAGIFTQFLPGLTRISENITIYRSTRDQALSWSNFFHIFPRVGQIARNLLGSLSSIGSAAGEWVTSMPGVNRLKSMNKIQEGNLKLSFQDRRGMDDTSLLDGFPNVDIVDVSEVDRSFGGHSYIEYNPWVQYDMYRIVRTGDSPLQRGLILQADDFQNTYWIIPKR